MLRQTVLKTRHRCSKECPVVDNETFIRAAFGVFWLALTAYWVRLMVGRRSALRRWEQLKHKEGLK